MRFCLFSFIGKFSRNQAEAARGAGERQLGACVEVLGDFEHELGGKDGEPESGGHCTRGFGVCRRCIAERLWVDEFQME